MEFELVLLPRLLPHYNNPDNKVSKDWITAVKENWFDMYMGYPINDKRIPQKIKNLANKELVNGYGKKIVKNSIDYYVDIKKYAYKNKKVYLTVKSKNSKRVRDKTAEEWIFTIKDNYGEAAADTWMEGNINIIENDIFTIELFLELESIKPIIKKSSRKASKKSSRKASKKSSRKTSRKESKDNKIRPSPSESATSFPVGTIKVGNDKNKWIITEDKNGTKRWKRIN